MAIKILCSCGTTILVSENKIGQTGNCPNCSSSIVVTLPNTSSHKNNVTSHNTSSPINPKNNLSSHKKRHQRKHPFHSFICFIFNFLFIILIAIEILTLAYIHPTIASDFDSFLDQARMAQQDIINHPYDTMSNAYDTIMKNIKNKAYEMQGQLKNLKNTIKKNDSKSNYRDKKIKSKYKEEKIKK